MIATGGMRVEHPLPQEGIDLRAELADHQRSRVKQALARAGGDLTEAARLLRVTQLELARLQAGVTLASNVAHANVAHTTGQTAARATAGRAAQQGPRAVSYDDLPRLDQGVERISAPVIRRLHAEGHTPRQIAGRLGCNLHVIEKVLRMQAEGDMRKCGARPPESPRGDRP